MKSGWKWLEVVGKGVTDGNVAIPPTAEVRGVAILLPDTELVSLPAGLDESSCRWSLRSCGALLRPVIQPWLAEYREDFRSG